MSLTLYSYMPNYRAWKALIAAEYNGVKIEVPEFHLHKDNTTPEFLSKNPLGKVPVLETPQGSIFESNAIARYVARLRGDSDLYGTGFFESAQVDQWIDFSANELEPTRAVWLFPVLGFMEFDQEAYDSAKNDIVKALTILNQHLQTRTFLVGHKITLADIVIVSALVDLYRMVFAPEFRAPFVNLNRWFNTCINQPQFAKVIGRVEFAAEEKKAAAGAGKKDNKKKDNKDNKKAEQPKAEQKQAAKPAAAAAAPAPAAAAGDDDEDKPKSKPKNPLDSLPPSKMILDATKKLFYEKRPKFDEFFTEFWGFFDAEGYSLYKSEYQYNDDNRVLFMTQNLVSGWLQRLEDLGKYGFGSVCVLGSDEDSPPFVINGVWIFRGSDVPAEMRECPDTEYHKLTRLNPTNAADRKVLQDYFTAETLEGMKVLDRRIFK